MDLLFIMGNIDIKAHYTLKNGMKKTMTITKPSYEIFSECAIKYKPLIIYGTKGKRSRKEGK